MKKKKYLGSGLAGLGAGAVNGLFGAGGGMVLVPLLTGLTDLPDEEIFPSVWFLSHIPCGTPLWIGA